VLEFASTFSPQCCTCLVSCHQSVVSYSSCLLYHQRTSSYCFGTLNARSCCAIQHFFGRSLLHLLAMTAAPMCSAVCKPEAGACIVCCSSAKSNVPFLGQLPPQLRRVLQHRRTAASAVSLKQRSALLAAHYAALIAALVGCLERHYPSFTGTRIL
jgi:hypothetical protein